MIQIKKTILTLVALLAVTTGAWAADVLNIVVSGTSATIKYDSNANNNPIFGGTDWVQSGYEWDEESTTRPTITTVTIDGSCKNFSGTSLHGLFIAFSGLTTINGLENLNTANVQDMKYMFAGCSSLTSLDLSSFNTANVTTMYSMFDGCSKLTTVDLSGWNTENVEKINALFYNCSELTTVDLSSWNTAKVWNTGYMFYNCPKLENIYVGDGWSTAAVTQSDYMFKGCTKLLSMNTANPATDKTNAHTGDGGYLKVKPSTPSGPEVAWDKAKKTGTFTMPGGNVTLEPEYYPQAALTAAPTAINDVPATTDGAIVKAGTVATIGSTENAQGTVMYYVSPKALDDAALLALAADKWTADVPTAKSLAEGQAYVYYYVRGNDSDTDEENFSDGDILAANALQVTLGAAPLWNAEFDLTDAPEADKTGKWSTNIPEGGVVKGTEVTVTYTGSKKVIGVKAEKKAAAPASTTLDNTMTAWTAGTFAVPAGGLTYSAAITVSGDVTLVLTDGETLTLNKGISLAEGATLTVEGNGTMVVNGTNGNSSSTVAGTGTLVLTSGTLNATGGNGHVGNDLGQFGMNGGISHGGSAINGSLTLEGGNVTATGGNGGNAGGSSINWATGGNGGSAITGNVIINGGNWTANNGSNGTLLSGGSNNVAGTGGKAVAGTVTDNR